MHLPPSRSERVARRGFCFLYAGLACSVSMLLLAPLASAALPVVDSCQESAYLDRTGPSADREFAWDFAFAADAERCITIRAGQRVHWNGDLASHPLDADEGDKPNPITTHDPSGFVTFMSPGIYGYRCSFHLAMRGAIQVLPAAPPAPAAVPWAPGPAAMRQTFLLGGVLVLVAQLVRRSQSPARYAKQSR